MNILILSDGRPGHLNQSIAFAKILGFHYQICDIQYKSKLHKLLSYLFDFLNIYTNVLFTMKQEDGKFDYVVGTGSTTAYPLKVLAKDFHCKSVSMMLPSGYRFDYDLIFAQSHDNPPKAQNIIEVPANFSYTVPKGIYMSSGQSVALIIGGNNAVFTFSKELLKSQLDAIFNTFNSYEIVLTTSPRTSGDIEDLLKTYPFKYSVYYSENPINPIPDFLTQCERVFITQDSTSMISEAVSNGSAFIEVLPLIGSKDNKFIRLTRILQEAGFLHIYDDTFGEANKKIDFKGYVERSGLFATNE